MKKIIASAVIMFMTSINLSFAIAPTFDNFKNDLVRDPSGRKETVFNPNTFKVSANKSLRDNIQALFSPTNSNSVIWNVIRIVMVGVLVLYFARTGIEFLLNPNDAGKMKAAKRSFLYLLFGAFLIYAVTWILGTALQIDVVQGSQGFLSNLIGRVLFQILSFLKAFAFFYALVLTIRYGISMIRALDKEDAIKAARKGIVNVIFALILIKVIDFIFFIAQDVNFVSRIKMFMINIARIVGYLLGAIMVFALVFAGFKYLGAQGDEAKVKGAKDTVTNIFAVVLIVFLFLLIARQVIAEFAP